MNEKDQTQQALHNAGGILGGNAGNFIDESLLDNILKAVGDPPPAPTGSVAPPPPPAAKASVRAGETVQQDKAVDDTEERAPAPSLHQKAERTLPWLFLIAALLLAGVILLRSGTMRIASPVEAANAGAVASPQTTAQAAPAEPSAPVSGPVPATAKRVTQTTQHIVSPQSTAVKIPARLPTNASRAEKDESSDQTSNVSVPKHFQSPSTHGPRLRTHPRRDSEDINPPVRRAENPPVVPRPVIAPSSPKSDKMGPPLFQMKE
jgi:hypothetical protein